MRRKRILMIPAVGLVVLAGIGTAIGLALAQGKSQQKNAYRNMTDGQLLQEALNYSAFQVTMGEMAVKQAASGEFRNYGRDMAAAHGKIRGDLEKLAAGKGIRIAPDIDQVRLNTARILSNEYGAAFDRNYMSLMVDENRRDAGLYRHMAEYAADNDLREFAGRVAPVLEGYAKRAEKALADLPFPFLK
jgi:putative membrane protein